ncbi:glycoside hydrolase family 2 [Streptomyces albofaciens JCM 4342]|uniref:PA14 domain-containing protein n=1 Tax=Streptomyces albofaciens TaxID=66866 RepID=UPI001238B4DD|nr:glycoside hydrolase family 2 [Streptomyces albofaciens JCM 4342]
MRRSLHTTPQLLLCALLFVLAAALPVSSLAPPARAVGKAAGLAAETTEPAKPAAALHASTHGLKGEYFRMSKPGARDFAELGGTTLEPAVDFPDLSSTFRITTGRTEHTTARWSGRIEVPRSGKYTFFAKGDNGFRLLIDGKPVIDHWVPDWDVEVKGEPVELAAGRQHDFRFEMFQDTGGSNMVLSWQGPDVKREPVPESAFTPPDGFEPYPVDLTVGTDGRRLRATFEDEARVTGALKDHLTLEVDSTDMPVASAVRDADDPRSVVLTPAGPVQKGQRVRFVYDGQGGLTSGGKRVPMVIRSAGNLSTHRLTTTWGDKADPDHPLPEYPRPQERRAKWKNLNGRWEFAGAREGEQPPFGKELAEKITVPFPVESQLSGIERHEDHMFYRRLITVPKSWHIGRTQRLKLNFGAVDYAARVWVNGTLVAEHTGGYTGFGADITDALTRGGKQEIIVGVTDTGGRDQPKGKQTPSPGGIFYTQSSGIWQTVWMEPVARTAVDRIVSTPDIGSGTLTVRAESRNASARAKVTAVARDKKGREVGRVTGAANADLGLKVRNQHLWSPDDPYLYDLEITLRDSGPKDVVKSYFGMRSIGVQKVGGHPKLVLNGKPFFSLAMLDQGFWPDGLYTQPSDDALRFDLEGQKRLGFNAVRKHIKVESPRWYYHADRLGLLVWQDFVSGDITGEQGQRAFVDQGREMMQQTHNSPAVGGYIVFNEGWGEWDREATGRLAETVKAADPSRVVNAHSGVNCCNSKGDAGKGDIIDHHDYNNDDPPVPDHRRAAMDGEHGGFTLRTPGHMWPGTPTVIYSGVADTEALTRKYVDNTRTFYLRQAGGNLSGSIYTQVSDLENELNGFWTYDRRKLKVDPARVRAVNREVIAAGAAAGG